MKLLLAFLSTTALFCLSACTSAQNDDAKKTTTDYPSTKEFNDNLSKIRALGVDVYDMHIHPRGGVTPQVAAERESKTGIKGALLANHGRGWEIESNEQLVDFQNYIKSVSIDGKHFLVGIQVNDRDWFKQIDAKTRAKFDYILADAMILPNPDGTFTKLWQVEQIDDPQAWMQRYFKHNMNVLDEPITIFANPTYLPKPIASKYDELWTDELLEAFISKAAKNGIALEIQAESPFQTNERFLKIAKKHGAKLSFGTNNRDGRAVDLSSWGTAVELGKLDKSNLYIPPARK